MPVYRLEVCELCGKDTKYPQTEEDPISHDISLSIVIKERGYETKKSTRIDFACDECRTFVHETLLNALRERKEGGSK